MKKSMIVNINIEFDQPIINTEAVLENIRMGLRRQLDELGISPNDEETCTEWLSLEYGDRSVIVFG